MTAYIYLLLHDYHVSVEIEIVVWVSRNLNLSNPLTKAQTGKLLELLQVTHLVGRLIVWIRNVRLYGPALQKEIKIARKRRGILKARYGLI